MSNEMITSLPTVPSAQLTDIIYAVQGYVSPSNLGTSVQETLQQVLSLIQSNIVTSYAGNPNGNVAGTVGQFVFDSTDGILYICTTAGSTSTAVWTPSNVANRYAGNPNTHVAGSIGQLLFDTAQNVLYVCTTTGNAGAAVWTPSVGQLTNGQLLIGSTGNTPVAATITAGTNITVTNTSGGITISASGSGGFSWTHVTAASQTMASNNGYIADRSSLITFSLPATSALGDEIQVIGRGSGGWTITEGTGQYIYFGNATTTTTSGSLSSSNAHDCVYLVCTLANTEWTVGNVQGNLTVV